MEPGKNVEIGAQNESEETPETLSDSQKEALERYLDELKIIAQRVGGDFGMRVELGMPGTGSFFDPEQNLIVFDPLNILEKPNQGRFIAGHEGSHRRITIHPKELGP